MASFGDLGSAISFHHQARTAEMDGYPAFMNTFNMAPFQGMQLPTLIPVVHLIPAVNALHTLLSHFHYLSCIPRLTSIQHLQFTAWVRIL